MKILSHICCGPCAIYPLKTMRSQGHAVTGFFYRHNIHPYTECQRRESTLRNYATTVSLNVIYQKGYDLEGFMQRTAFRESERCRLCYHDRLQATALVAKRGKFDAFTSTLLYSKFQNHQQVIETGNAVANATGIPFYVEDFRIGWKEGVTASKQLGMYRQAYCGCVYSEKERFYRPSDHK